MSFGYFGKILSVDLSKEVIEEKPIPEKYYHEYIGGHGLGCKLLYDDMPKNVDPLGPDSILGFFPGLLTGTSAPFSGRYMVVGKSPLTGCWADANSGGTFGPEIKKCGYDGILIKGAASSPKYLSVLEGNAEIMDAGDLWGLDVVKAENNLKEKHGKFIKTAGIGKAGENVSLISAIINDKGRAAGRCGVGAIMGSKKLKMLVLKGKTRLSIKDKSKFINSVKKYNSQMEGKKSGFLTKKIVNMIPKVSKTLRRVNMGMDQTPPFLFKKIFHKFGTTSSNTLSVEVGDTPIKNWTGINKDFPSKRYLKLSAMALDEYVEKPYGCFSCPLQCGAIMKVPELGLEETHRPEYETCSTFGADILNDDLMSIFIVNELCNNEGMDTISAGATVAFAIECYENGLITKEDTGGLELTWGNAESAIELLKMMINREGIGDILADGVKVASEKIGKGSEKYAIHSHGQEIAMHNPRIFKSLAYSYAYNPTPGRHTTSSVDFTDIMGTLGTCFRGLKVPKKWKDDDKKRVEVQVLCNSFHEFSACLGLCLFSSYFQDYPGIELINSLTGWEMNVNDLIKAGSRIHNLKQSFNLREGIDLSKNEISGRVNGEPPFEEGPTKGITVDYKDFFKDVCEKEGWNPENGYPLKQTLQDLNLDFVIKDLY